MNKSGRPRNKPINRPKPKMIRMDFRDEGEKRLWEKFEEQMYKDSNKDRVLYLVRLFNQQIEKIEETESLIKIKMLESAGNMFKSAGFEIEGDVIGMLLNIIAVPWDRDKLDRFNDAVTQFSNYEGKLEKAKREAKE